PTRADCRRKFSRRHGHTRRRGEVLDRGVVVPNAPCTSPKRHAISIAAAIAAAVDQSSGAGLDGPRAAVRWTVRRSVEPGAVAMSAIGGHRAVEGYGCGLCVRDSQHRNPTNGRQGKRPASGAAYVVGKIENFANISDTPYWRSLR